MAHGHFQRNDLRVGQNVRLDAQVVVASQVMRLNAIELEEVIRQELAENPALERVGGEAEAPVETAVSFRSCTRNLREDHEGWRSGGEDDGVEVVELSGRDITLHEYLLAQVSKPAHEELANVLETVVQSVNDRGYLGLSAEEIALSANCSLEEVEDAINIVQQCDPPGVAARSVAECIALQLRVEDHPHAKQAYKAVTDHFDWVVQKNTRSLSRALRCTPDVVEEIFTLIASLEPYPGEQFSPSSHVTSQSRTEGRALPEIIFNRDDNGWDVQIMGSDQSDLRINQTYTTAIDDAKKAKSKQSTVHLVEFVKRADRLLNALEQRKETLRRIAAFLLEYQKGFILTGQFRFLEDLTRARLAEEVGLHESTISRATNGKCIQLATGEVVSFDLFFNHSLKIRDLIGEILGFENPNKPLSDAEIAKRLNDQGIQIARRTIAKYRDRDKHLSSRVRRTA